MEQAIFYLYISIYVDKSDTIILLHEFLRKQLSISPKSGLPLVQIVSYDCLYVRTYQRWNFLEPLFPQQQTQLVLCRAQRIAVPQNAEAFYVSGEHLRLHSLVHMVSWGQSCYTQTPKKAVIIQQCL